MTIRSERLKRKERVFELNEPIVRVSAFHQL